MKKRLMIKRSVLVVLVFIGAVCSSAAQAVTKEFTFSADPEGCESGGNWEAEFGKPAVEQSDGALKINVNMKGAGDWEELRVMNKTIGDLSEYGEIEYEFYIPTAGVTQGKLRPYIVLDPGWTKIGIDAVKTAVKRLPVETINGNEYFKLAVKTNLGEAIGKNVIYIGFVGSKFPYQGPVYLDNVRLIARESSPVEGAEALEGDAAAGLLEHRGQALFASGMNLAWIDFGRDLTMFNEPRFIFALDDIAKAKGNTLRWWLHVNGSRSPLFGEDGKVRGLDERDIPNMKRALDLAYERGILIVMCLWSFDMLQDQHQVNQEWNKKLVEDPDYTRAYIDNALIPIVRDLKGHPGILAWEICNEPEGMTSEHGWTPVRTQMKYVQQFVNLLAGAIHRADPDAKVTNGTWNLRVMTDVDGMTNYYRDDRLIEAGGDPDGVLDFYQVHYYPQHFDESTSPFHHPASYWKLDKPILIGEFPAKGIKDIGQGFKPKKSFPNIIKVYDFAYKNGYAGALGWTWTGHDGFGGVVDAAPGMLWLHRKFPEHIIVDTSGVNKIPTVVQAVEKAVVPMNSADIAEYVNLKNIFQDAEDGTDLTFQIEANSAPELVTPVIQESGALSLQLAKDAAGIAELTIKAVDSGGNFARIQFAVLVLDPDSGNVALMKPATASSVESDIYKPEFANDGDKNTRWSTQYKDDEWLEIDLEGMFLINQIILKWEVAYGKHYEILISEDREHWTTLFTEQYSDGQVDEILFETVPVRYIRMHGIQRGTQWGFSLWELEVYGKRVAQ